MEDNVDRLLEAIEYPERFSDDELDSLLSDSETRQLYNIMSKMSATFDSIPEPDIDKEWNRFVSRHSKTKTGLFSIFFSRHAAAVLIIGICSLAVVATTLSIKYSTEHHELEETPVTVSKERKVITDALTDETAELDSVQTAGLSVSEPIIFKDETLEHILTSICRYYDATVLFTNRETGNLHLYFRWDTTQSLNDVVEQLNSFGQISIVLDKNVLTVE